MEYFHTSSFLEHHEVDGCNKDDNGDDDERTDMAPKTTYLVWWCCTSAESGLETSAQQQNKSWRISKSKSMNSNQKVPTVQCTTHLPTSRNSPTRRCRLMAISMPRTVMPSQKQATTLALGRWPRSFCSSLSKLRSPALLYILSEWAMQIPSFAAMSLNASIPLSP